jgi:hypothetical protein
VTLMDSPKLVITLMNAWLVLFEGEFSAVKVYSYISRARHLR